jgi:hypothetical protein
MPVFGFLAAYIRCGLLLLVAAWLGPKLCILVWVGGEAGAISRNRKRLRIEGLSVLLGVDWLLPDGIRVIVLLLLHWF